MIDIGKIIVARRSEKGLTQHELAKRLRMPPAQLCLIENGKTSPTVRTLERIAEALDSSLIALLCGEKNPDEEKNTPPVQPLNGDYVALRKGDAVAVDALASIMEEEEKRDRLEDAHGISSACSLPLNHAEARLEGTGASVAEVFRMAIGAGTLPIGNLTQVLELHGVRIYKRRLESSSFSISFWNKTRSSLSIVLNSGNTPERDIYRLACEVACAILFVSNGGEPIGDTHAHHRFIAEFASSFLMPATVVRQMAARTLIDRDAWTLQAICSLKIHFGVSAEAFALRLEELGIIAPSLRLEIRRLLRAYYPAHPGDKEPPPSLSQRQIDFH